MEGRNQEPRDVGAKSPTSLAVQHDEALDRRRLKKRESDRKCQRLSRQRQKSRVKYLESLVDQLKEANSSGQLDTLLQKISRLQTEKDLLEKKLTAIQGILHSGQAQNPAHVNAGRRALSTSNDGISLLQKEGASTPLGHGFPRGGNHSSSDPGELDEQVSLSQQNSIPEKGVGSERFQEEGPNTWLHEPLPATPKIALHRHYLGMPYPTVSTQIASLLSGQTCGCGQAYAQKRRNQNHWYGSNFTLGAWMNWPSLAFVFPDADPYHEDTSLRAVIEGWDAVERRGNVHPIWRLMRVMDESLFKHCENSTMRLVILYGASHLMLAHIDPSRVLYSKLPPYMRELEEQTNSAYATNFPAWLGVRKVLIANEHRYCSNRFWYMFMNSLRFRWPFEFQDCYLYNTSTAIYSLSPTYLEVADDLRAVGVTRDFLESYPEFRGLAITVDEIPPSIRMESPDSHFTNVGNDALGFPEQSQQCFASPIDIQGQVGSEGAAQDVAAGHGHEYRDTVNRPTINPPSIPPHITGDVAPPSAILDNMLPLPFNDPCSALEEDLVVEQDDGMRTEAWHDEEERLLQMPAWATAFQANFFPDRDFL